jgi:predicted nucleic acid-binding protein
MLLDTNIVSEMWRLRPDPLVSEWLNTQPATNLYICTPVLAEIRAGIERLQLGPRRTFLSGMCEQLMNKGYRGRILELDIAAAMEFGRITALRERLGRRLDPLDAMIAAIALAQRMALVTRNIDDFADIGLDLIDPFSQPAG